MCGTLDPGSAGGECYRGTHGQVNDIATISILKEVNLLSNLPPNPYGSHPENDPQQPVGEQQNYGQLPPLPNFESDASAPLYGEAVLIREAGERPSISDAVSYGFRATFKNWKTFIPFGVIWILLQGAAIVPSFTNPAQFDPGNPEVDFNGTFAAGFGSVFTLILGVFLLNAALQAAAGLPTTFGGSFKNARFFPTLGAYILFTIISSLLMAIPPIVMVAGVVGSVATLGENSDVVGGVILQALAASFVLFVVLGLINILFTYMPYFTSAGSGVFASVGLSVKMVRRNYLRVLGMTIVTLLLVMLGTLFFGLGLVVVLPAVTIANAYFFREACKQPVPVA